MRGSGEFLAASKYGGEVGRFLFLGDDADFDFLETGVLEPFVEITLGETGPAIPKQIVGFLEIMLQQIEDENAPAGNQRGGWGLSGKTLRVRCAACRTLMWMVMAANARTPLGTNTIAPCAQAVRWRLGGADAR